MDHQILLQDLKAKIHTGAIYKTTWEEDGALQQYVDENLPTGKVRRSCSATGAPILFALKKDGLQTLVIDYRDLKRLTISNMYPLPLISQLLDNLEVVTGFPDWTS